MMTMMKTCLFPLLIVAPASAFAPASRVQVLTTTPHFVNHGLRTTRTTTTTSRSPSPLAFQQIQIQSSHKETHASSSTSRTSTTQLFAASSSSEKANAASIAIPSEAKPFLSASILILFDIAVRRILRKAAISFPSSLAGCGALFVMLLTLPIGPKLFQILSPGAALLAKWLPVFFVPSLITLPLAAGMGSTIEVRYGSDDLQFSIIMVSFLLSIPSLLERSPHASDPFHCPPFCIILYIYMYRLSRCYRSFWEVSILHF